jgi:hypothetical protein
VDGVANTGSGSSGTLRLELWAFLSPYSGKSINGYLLGSYQFPQVLGANQYYSGITQSVPFTAPPAGTYYTSLLLEEYTGTNWFTQDYVTSNSTQRWGLVISGNTSWQPSAGGVTIQVDRVSNTASGTTGSIRLRLWATASRYSGGVIYGYALASYQFAQVLGLTQFYSGVTQTVPFSRPPTGAYYTTLTLEEYTGSDWVIRDYVTYSSTQTF